MNRQQLLKEEKELTFKMMNFFTIKNRKPRRYGTEDLLYIAEADMINIVGENQNVSASDIAKMLNITKSAVSKTIIKLNKKGIVEQIQDKNDSRRMILTLTSKGKIIYNTHKNIDISTDNYRNSALADCTDDEIRAYIKVASINVKTMYEVVGTND